MSDKEDAFHTSSSEADTMRVPSGDMHKQFIILVSPVSVVTSEVVANAKARVKTLRRERQALQDKLLALNVNTLITVGEEDLAVLKEEGIL